MAIPLSAVAILVLAAASLASANHNTNFPTLDFRTVRDRIVPAVQDLLRDRSKIGTVVRFSFHECTGGPGCDGCLDPNQGRNVGLEGIQRDLDNIYSQLRLGNNVMSRADFYMLAGLIAANSAVPRGARMPQKLRIESFRWGRRECATSPMAQNDNGDDFPGPNMNWDENMAFFATRFGFNERETVAINGAHNLGRAHPQFTGFTGQWVRDNDQLSGSYFKNIRDTNQRFTQIFSNNGQWTSRTQNGITMLNTDLVLYRDLGDTSDGRSSCPSDASQCRTVPTRGVVDEYANNPQTFLDDFADVFTKMMEVCNRDARGNPIRDPSRGGCNLRNMSNLPADDNPTVVPVASPKPCRKKRCPVVNDLPGDGGNATALPSPPPPKPCKKKRGCPAP